MPLDGITLSFAVRGMWHLFGGRIDRATQPEKDMVDEILRSLGVDREDAVYIGDSNVDLLTASNSGMDCIAVSWGFRGRAKLEEYGAKTIIDKPVELLGLLFC